MIYKPSLISPIAAAYLALSTCLISTSLMAQTQSSPTPSPIPPASTSLATSNLISNNPFVPKSNGSLNKPKTTLGAQSTANKPKVLQKYLEFKSIAIINNKKYVNDKNDEQTYVKFCSVIEELSTKISKDLNIEFKPHNVEQLLFSRPGPQKLSWRKYVENFG